MSLPVVILAGGMATRLGSLARSTPKALTDIGGRPFAEHQIELLRSHGLKDLTFLVSHLGNAIAEALGDGSRFGVRLRYIFDGPLRLGTGGAIRRALPQLDESFFVLYGDSYLECDYADIERAFLSCRKRGLMTVYRNHGRLDASNVLFFPQGIVRYDKAHRTDDMQHIDFGLGAFKSSAFSERPEAPFDLAEVYQDLLAVQDLAAYEVQTRFYEIGSLSGLEETRIHLGRKATEHNELL